MTRKILVSGLCQMAGMVSSLSLMLPDDTISLVHNLSGLNEDDLTKAISFADVLLTIRQSPDVLKKIETINKNLEIYFWPQIFFDAFHPDIVMFSVDGVSIKTMDSVYNSTIALWSWYHRVPIERAIDLFAENVLIDLGYLDRWEDSVSRLKADFDDCQLDFNLFFQSVKRQGVFMHSYKHAKLSPTVHLARQLACKLGASKNFVNEPIEDFLEDPLIFDAVWPVYPAIADALGVNGCFRWKSRTRSCTSLQKYIELCYKDYDAQSSFLINRSSIPISSHVDKVLKSEIGR